MSTLSQFFSGGKSQSQVFTSGSGNWTVPIGVTSVRVLLVGGGGGGGGGHTATYQGGGGGGGAIVAADLKVTPGASLAYSVGGGGAGGGDTASGTAEGS